MGVDVTIFDKLSKQRYPLDRYRVFNAYDTESIVLEDLLKRFYGYQNGLNRDDSKVLLKLLLEHHLEHEDDRDSLGYKRYWIDQAGEFIDNRPNGIFFIINDHDDDYHYSIDDYERVKSP